MPSFLNTQQERSQLDSHSAGIVHLDPDSRFGLAHEKAHHNPPPLSPSHNNPNDSFDDEASSSSSSNTSESSTTQTRLNGNSSAATTMTSTTMMMNGKAAREGLGPVQTDVGRKPMTNGFTTSTVLVDRTVPQQPQQPPPPPPHPTSRLSNGTREGDLSPSPSPQDAHPRASMASTNGESIQPSPVELHIRSVSKMEVLTVDSSASLTVPAPSPATFLSHPTSPGPPTPNSDVLHRNLSTPHRFSSPPHYNSAGQTPTSSSGALSPPAPGIKHRHTLEVPKVGPSRGSREGVEAAYASGRFSPTASNGPVGSVRRGSLSLGRRNTRSLHSEVPRDDAIPDDDAIRWAEAIRQKRASKRKREAEDDDRVLVGTKVDEKHANWVAAYNMLTGIRVSVSRTNAKLDRPLTDEDFEAKQKSTFDIAGNELVPSAKYDFKFKDYAPWVFRRLRALFGLDPADYLMSLTGKYILSELGSPGKSGSFFYFSRDYKYIIKTIHHAEHKFLRKILKEYYEHVSNNPNMLLSQFYGLHRVKVPYGRKIHFVVMNNLFPPHRDIHQTFDLKGSTIGRDYKEDDLGKNPRATLKDLNWLRRQRHLELGIQKKQLFLEQLRKDVALLQKLKIMDYSLLIGIHDLKRGNEENLRHKTLQVFNPGSAAAASPAEDPQSVLLRTPSKLENQRKARELRQMIQAERPTPMGIGSTTMPEELEEGQTKSDCVFYKDDGGFQATHEDNTPGEEIYYLGVIDCLTHYGMIKKIEHFWKGLSNDRTQISALPPQEYGERFYNFMSGITMSPEEAHREARDRDARLQAEAAAAEAAATAGSDQQDGGNTQGKERVSSWNGSVRHKAAAPPVPSIPPVPTHQPPPIPSQASPGAVSASSGVSVPRSPEIEAVMRRAEHEAFKKADREEDVPERILRTTAAAPGGLRVPGAGGSGPASPVSERRESAQAPPVLPVVEEAAEASSSTGGRSRSHGSRPVSSLSGLTSDSERPLTPAKDGTETAAGFGLLSYSSSNKGSKGSRVGTASPASGGATTVSPTSSVIPPPPGHPPPTPPKSSHQHNMQAHNNNHHHHHGLLKPESADSGYGVIGAGVSRARSGSTSGSLRRVVKGQISRDSLDKALPPLPPHNDGVASMDRA